MSHRLCWAWLMMVGSATCAWSTETVDALQQASWSAFERGLLPVSDFLEHSVATQDWRLEQLPSIADQRRVLEALRPRLTDLRRAVQAMERFHQPAAKDWAADLALLRYSLAHAESEVVAITGQRSAVLSLSKTESQRALEHYRQRVFDDRILGHASLPHVMEAAAMLPVTPSVERQLRRQVIVTTALWNRAGAGIGRQDQLVHAEFNLIRTATTHVTDQPTAADRQAFVDADRFAARLFDEQRAYYRHGTATLGDLARSWRLRREVQDQALRVKIELPQAAQPDLQADLETLAQLADRTSDRRGRAASDALYVQLLRDVQAARRGR